MRVEGAKAPWPSRSQVVRAVRNLVNNPTRKLNLARSSGDQLKLCPQPQVRVAFGFVIEKPDWSSPSL
jgi:hypothetical protein